LIYHRESCAQELKRSMWKKLKDVPGVKVWVNSDYLNVRGFRQFGIKSTPSLTAEHVILYGPTPEKVHADKITRLPLHDFRIRGSIISDTGEKMVLK
jgi:hypothetical protein